MKKKVLLSVFLVIIMLFASVFTLIACGKKDDTGTQSKEPVINVAENALTCKSREDITLPKATATDAKDGDITSDLKVKVYFETDAEDVYPYVNPVKGAPAAEENIFTPVKIGPYKVIYFVTNSAGAIAKKEISLTVTENDAPKAQNMVNEAAFVNSGNAAFNSFEELEVGKVPQGGEYQGFFSATYKGKKVKSGDIVSFRFSMESPEKSVWYYSISPFMTKSYAADVPAQDEGNIPEYFSLRVLPGGGIESYASTSKNLRIFDAINTVNLFDGKDHTISMQFTVSGDYAQKTGKVDAKIWIDKQTNSSPSAQSTVTQQMFDEVYGEGKYNQDIFNAEKAGGWFSVGGMRGSNLPSDIFTVKALTFNNEAFLVAPKLSVDEPNLYGNVINQEIELPVAKAIDQNDYTDVSSLVEIRVVAPNGEASKLDGNKFTPTEKGKYEIIYLVKDLSGNVSYQLFELYCSDGESEEPPTIEFEGTIENLQAKVGEPFALPVVASVTDSFGNDLRDRLSIDITTMELFNIDTAAEEYTFYAEGTYVIEYSVIDYNGNQAVETVEVIVTAEGNEGNILLNQDEWFYGSTGSFNADGSFDITLGSVVYKSQKIYDEQVSLRINANIASSFGAKDGSDFITFNLRGGKNLGYVPGAPGEGNNFDWPNALNLELTTQGFTVYNGSHGINEYGNAKLPDGILPKDYFNGQDRIISWKVTDVYEGETLNGILIQVWVDGVKLNFEGKYRDNNGDLFIEQRAVNASPMLRSAGWLAIGNIVMNSGTFNTNFNISAITIDGSEPKVYSIEMAEPAYEAALGGEYTVPVAKVLYGTEDVSDRLEVYAVKSGESWTESEELSEMKFLVSEEYISGFEIVYVVDGRVLKSYRVSVLADVSDLTFDNDDALTAQIGASITLPKVTSVNVGGSLLNAEQLAKISVVAVNEEQSRRQVLEGTEYAVETRGDVILEYYYGTVLLGTREVTVTGAVQGDISGQLIYDNGTTVYNYSGAEKIYSNLVSVKFTVNDTSTLSRVHFAIRQSNGSGYPVGLALRIAGGELRIAMDGGGEDKIAVKPEIDWTGTHVMNYKATDIYDVNNQLIGIKIEVWLDGERVVFGGSVDAEGNCIVPANKIDASAKTATKFYFNIVSSNSNACVLEQVRIDGTICKNYTIEMEEPIKEIALGELYTLKDAVVKCDGADITSELKIYVVKPGEDWSEAAAITEKQFTVGEEYIAGFKVYYVAQGVVLKEFNVKVTAEVSEVVFDNDDNLTAAIGTSVTVPQLTGAKIGAIALTAEQLEQVVVVAVNEEQSRRQVLDGAEYAVETRGNVTLEYYYGTVLLGTREVTVTGAVQGDISDQLSYDDYNGVYNYSGTEKIYSNLVSVKFTINDTSTLSRVHFAIRQSNGSGYPVGLALRIAGDQLRVAMDGGGDDMIAVKGGFDWMGTHVINYKATDIYDVNNQIIGIKVEVWLNGEKVVFTGSIDSEGNCLVPAEKIDASAKTATKFYFNMVSNNPNACVLDEVRIDGTNCKNYTIEMEEPIKEIALGSVYTLKDAVVKCDGEDITSELKIYVVKPGEDWSEAAAITGKQFTVGEEYIAGFKVYYVAQGVVLKEFNVKVTAEVSEVTFDNSEGLTAAIGTSVTVPQITGAKIGAISLTAEQLEQVVVVAVNEEQSRRQILDGTEYAVETRGNVVFEYYYGTVLLGTREVTVTGAVQGDISEQLVYDGGTTVYNYSGAEKIYSNLVSVKFTVNDTSELSRVHFAIRQSNGSGYPVGLALRIAGGELRVAMDAGGDDMIAVKPEINWMGTHILNYKATDIYDVNNQIIGIKVEVWLDGEKVVFTGNNADAEGNCIVPAEKIDASAQTATKYYFNVIAGEGDVVLEELRIDGTSCVQE